LRANPGATTHPDAPHRSACVCDARLSYARNGVRSDAPSLAFGNRTVPYVSTPGAPISTRAAFTVRSGEPGLIEE
jgi:hypothetical protein